MLRFSSILVFASYLLLQRPALSWLLGLWTRDDLRMHLLFGIAAAIATIVYLRHDGILAQLKKPMTARPLPLLILGSSLLLQVGMHRIADVDLLDVALFGVGFWALMGLILERTLWWRLLPVLLLGLCLLPLEGAVDAYLGYPARRLTAMFVAGLLNHLGLPVMDAATVLTLDTPGGAVHTQVDVPCAGVRSLWSGSLFFLGLVVLRGRGFDGRSVFCAPVLWLLLLGTNTMRVTMLVILQQGLRQPWIADQVHVPLGILGFIISLLVSGVMMTIGETPILRPATPSIELKSRIPLLLSPTLLLLSALDTPASEHLSPVGFHWRPPAGWTLETAPLSSLESAFFSDLDGGEAPTKTRFSTTGLSGSLILVPARSWRAHHLPENCLAPLGVEGVHTVLLTDDLPVRLATADHQHFTLLWWFEAEDQRTDDLFTRAWADLSGQQDRWVMVSFLLDGTPPLSTLSTQIPPLAASVRAGLER